MARQQYSVWFMPTGAVREKYSKLISQLAEQYSSPVFPPHITLVGNVKEDEEQVVLKTQEIAAQLHTCLIKLTHVDYTDYYYRCLFIRVEPSADLLTAYQTARKIFPTDQEASYIPHLSLLYGDFSIETKREIIGRIGNTFTDEFEASVLYLYQTTGEVSTWRKIKEFPLR